MTEAHCLQSLTDVHVGLVTRELRSVAPGEVEDTGSILPLQRELQGADLATGSERARRPQEGRNRPEGGHCVWTKEKGKLRKEGRKQEVIQGGGGRWKMGKEMVKTRSSK